MATPSEGIFDAVTTAQCFGSLVTTMANPAPHGPNLCALILPIPNALRTNLFILASLRLSLPVSFIGRNYRPFFPILAALIAHIAMSPFIAAKNSAAITTAEVVVVLVKGRNTHDFNPQLHHRMPCHNRRLPQYSTISSSNSLRPAVSVLNSSNPLADATIPSLPLTGSNCSPTRMQPRVSSLMFPL